MIHLRASLSVAMCRFSRIIADVAYILLILMLPREPNTSLRFWWGTFLHEFMCYMLVRGCKWGTYCHKKLCYSCWISMTWGTSDCWFECFFCAENIPADCMWHMCYISVPGLLTKVLFRAKHQADHQLNAPSPLTTHMHKVTQGSRVHSTCLALEACVTSAIIILFGEGVDT